VLFMSQWVVQRDSRWFDRPDEFLPERWLDGLHRRLPKGAFIPFGSGSRRCLGGTFANWEAALCLATIVRGSKLGVEPGARIRPKPSFTLRPVGLRLIVRPRASA
jgi:cytochrome P450